MVPSLLNTASITKHSALKNILNTEKCHSGNRKWAVGVLHQFPFRCSLFTVSPNHILLVPPQGHVAPCAQSLLRAFLL